MNVIPLRLRCSLLEVAVFESIEGLVFVQCTITCYELIVTYDFFLMLSFYFVHMLI